MVGALVHRDQVMKSKNKVVVFGYTDLAARILDLLESLGIQTLFLVLPSNRQGKEVEIARSKALEKGIPVLFHDQPDRRSFHQKLAGTPPELGISASYSHILSKRLINIPKNGFINLHGTPLPRYRGPHTLNWQIINGEVEGGVTLHYIDEGIDTGDIIDRITFPIQDDDTAQDLKPRIKEMGIQLLAEHLQNVLDGSAPRVKQAGTEADAYPPRKPGDGLIDFSWSVKKIYDFIRALAAPYPGAFYYKKGRKILIRRYRSLEWVTALKNEHLPIKSLVSQSLVFLPHAGRGHQSPGRGDRKAFSFVMEVNEDGIKRGCFTFHPLSLGDRTAYLSWDGAGVETALSEKILSQAFRFGRQELELQDIKMCG